MLFFLDYFKACLPIAMIKKRNSTGCLHECVFFEHKSGILFFNAKMTWWYGSFGGKPFPFCEFVKKVKKLHFKFGKKVVIFEIAVFHIEAHQKFFQIHKNMQNSV